jgi:hypothetical protein
MTTTRITADPDRQSVDSIDVAPYVPDVAKLQLRCGFAETPPGEATFGKPVE